MAENSVADELSKLNHLRDSGVLTEAEFQAEKQRLLSRPATKESAPYWRPDWTPNRRLKSRRTRKRSLSLRRVVGVTVGCAVVVAIIVVGAVHHGNSPSPSSTPSATKGIGQVAKDGDFAFVVKGVSCGAKADAVVTGAGETVPAAAQECLVRLTITDDTGTSQTYFAGNQYAFDSAGRQFSADATATESLVSANDDTELRPGVAITAILPFQIPANDTIVRLELHDSAYSGGVTVHL